MTNKETEAARDWCKNQFVNNGENGIISPELQGLLGKKGKVWINYKFDGSDKREVDCELLAIYIDGRCIIQCYDINGNKWPNETLSKVVFFIPNESQPAPVEGEGDYKTALEDALPIVIAFSAIQTHGNLPVHPQHKELIDRIGKLITKK